MRLKRNSSAQSIMQLELFPVDGLKVLSKTLSTISTRITLPTRTEREKYCDELLARCSAYGHCTMSVLTALCCLYQEIETYSKEQFELDIQPYL